MEATGGLSRRRPVLSAPAVLMRVLVLGALAAFIGAVYLALPVGLGLLVGWGPNTTLSVAATVVVALLFSRVRERAQQIAQRLVQGERASPYEVLAELSDRMAGAYPTPDMLPQMARIVAEGSGAAGARVWLRLGEKLVPAAAWPADSVELSAVRLASDALPPLPDTHFGLPVRHGGELIGGLTVTQLPGEPLSPADQVLLEHIAAEAGLVLRNVQLTAELESSLAEISARAGEIRASRQRIVATQDAERRRVERDIHDGAQQHLVGLMVQLRVARRVVNRDPGRAGRIVGDLQPVLNEALKTLADLAQGIHPPLLTAHGLPVALRQQESNPSVRVTVSDDGVGRYRAEVEAAVYFTCLEALNNAAKHAPGSEVTVHLSEDGGHVVFSVRDDGSGFDPAQCRPGSGLGNMVDRVAALRGTLEVTSAPSRGTCVTGRIPLERGEAA